jgi:hypothetical protein
MRGFQKPKNLPEGIFGSFEFGVGGPLPGRIDCNFLHVVVECNPAPKGGPIDFHVWFAGDNLTDLCPKSIVEFSLDIAPDFSTSEIFSFLFVAVMGLS